MPQYVPARVSIITPAFKAAGIVGETIKSVQAQTYDDWEMFVVDDHSPDRTAEIVNQFTTEDPRISLIRLAKNSGPAAARNAALSVATGQWIAFLDCDDLWLPKKLSKSLEFAAEEDAGFIYTSYRRMSADGSRIGRQIRVPRQLDYRALLGNTAITTSTVMLNRWRIGPITMENTYYDDWDCWLRILKQGHVARGLEEDLTRYRVLRGSISRNKLKSALRVLTAYRRRENLGVAATCWYFGLYAYNGWEKYRKF